MHVFIKAHSRPYMLERCIASLTTYARGVSNVFVLNDGLTPTAADKIKGLFPYVHMLPSPRAILGWVAGAPPVSGVDADPAHFWSSAIEKYADDYFLLLEEDTWLVADVDLAAIAHTMRTHEVLHTKLFWHGHSDSITGVTLADSPQGLRLFVPPVEKYTDMYRWFNMAQCVYEKNYWLAAYHDIPHWLQESHCLQEAFIYMAMAKDAGRPVCVAHTEKEVVRHTTLSTSREDGGLLADEPLDVVHLNNVLSEAWLDDAWRMPPVRDEHEALQHVEALLYAKREHELAEAWGNWRVRFLAHYEGLGCRL